MKRPLEAFRSSALFETGLGYLAVSRFKADGHVETGFFLIDVFCLGVKDAGFCQFRDETDLQDNLLASLFRDAEPVRLTPAAARKLAEDAVAYAKGLGFSPAADYKKASRVFGGVSTVDCEERFVFGKDGKPFYIQGPSESPARCERILRVLEASCGEGGYHYIVAAGDSTPADDPDEFVEEDILPGDQHAGPGGPVALRAMAERLQAKQPNLEVLINPAGRRKVSDMISLVAEPLLEDAPDYAAKKAILYLAGLAWNFSLLPPPAQKGMFEEIEGLFPGPEVIEMFALLVARSIALFPDEDRLIIHLETEPEPSGDIGLRVASAM